MSGICIRSPGDALTNLELQAEGPMERRRPAARWLEIRDGLPFAMALVSLDGRWWLAECGAGESIHTPSRPVDRDNCTGLPAAVRALLREIDGDRPCQLRAERADCTALSDVFSCRTQSRATHLSEEGEVRAEPRELAPAALQRAPM